MLNDWAFIGLFLIMAAIFPGAPIVLNSLIFGPKKSNPVKNSAYECGIETVGDTWVQFKVQYYIFALVFVVFDVETVFLFPFAVAFGQVGLFAVVEVVFFILILAAALVYAWRKGALQWV
ncbi:MAG TPA: NADH-quinone oxidoreductase subunit A [Anaerolineales bacterium]|nr:NADH-quinone oxidoreductase subunit A [Anaerolineales bacterium]